jgi:hypothetical protein
MKMLKLDEKNRAAGPSCGLTRMAEPMTPRTLEALGVPRPFPVPRPAFAPDGDWTAMYRVWGGHGWIDCAYKTLGVLRLERRTDGSAVDAGFHLGVQQKIVYEGGIVHTIEARTQSAADRIGSLRKWNVRSEITTTSGEPEPRLGLVYSGCVSEDGTSWREKISGVRETTVEHAVDTHLTSDWSLLEAVQRLPSGSVDGTSFDLLEGMTMLKRDYRLYFREKPEDGLQKQEMPLHRFYLIGRGQLPVDYWVDDQHRLIMAISGSRAYFLDDGAEELFLATLEQQRQGRGFHE